MPTPESDGSTGDAVSTGSRGSATEAPDVSATDQDWLLSAGKSIKIS